MKKLVIGTLVLLLNIGSLNISAAQAHPRTNVKNPPIKLKHSKFKKKIKNPRIRPMRVSRNWVDVKEHVGFCESKGNYSARNRRSTASGKYQFLNSTWAGRYGIKRAYLATPEQQEQAALELHAARGLQPWKASQRCWGPKI